MPPFTHIPAPAEIIKTGHILISPYNCIPAKIPPPTLHIRVQVWLLQLAPSALPPIPHFPGHTCDNECVRSYRKVSVTAVSKLVLGS